MIIQRNITQKMLIVLCSVILCFASYADNLTETPQPISGRDPQNTQQIIPADVLARVKLLNAQLNQIGKALGKPQAPQPLIIVNNASPREVYFEAQSLFEKTNRLAYEVEGSYEDTPKLHSEQLLPAHVWQLVDASLKRVLSVKEYLGIKGTIKEIAEPTNTTPTDVFNALLSSNQKVNTLLYYRVTPSDVFEQLTLAINYTEQLLKQFNLEKRIPDAPKFIPDKTPTDVYARLITCIQLLQSIAQKSQIKMLNIEMNNLESHPATPSDAYDLSKVIVAEVRYLSTLLPATEKIESYYPGYKTPSDVFQRAGILLQQLEQLKSEVDKNPAWLKTGHLEVTP